MQNCIVKCNAKIIQIFLLVCMIVISLGIVACSSTEDMAKNSYVANTDKFLGEIENVHVTFHSGPDVHDWELTQDEIDDWEEWFDTLSLEQENFEKSNTPDDNFKGGSRYVFDVNDDERCLEYIDYGADNTYLLFKNVWYKVNNPTEPFNKY